MPAKPSKISLQIKSYLAVFQPVKSQPKLLFPFVSFAVLECFGLLVAYLSPREPFVKVLGPLIRAFWGEQYLHYPNNFILLPRLAYLTNIFFSVFAASLFTGVAIGMFTEAYNKKKINIVSCIKAASKRYVSLFSIVLLAAFLFFFLRQGLLFGLKKYFLSGKDTLFSLGRGFWSGIFLFSANFLLSVFIQAAFVYAIPLVIIENEKLLIAIKRSFGLFKRYFLPTLVFVGLPMFLFLSFVLLNANSALLIKKFFPESVLIAVSAGILVNALIIDPLINYSALFFYLNHKSDV